MPPLEKEVIIPRMLGIERDVVKLESLAKIEFDTFISQEKFENAQLHLHHALEGVFNIASHILARSRGGSATAYRDIALKFAEFGFIEKSFAENSMRQMAGYRNRLVHFYAEISPKEIYEIINTKLSDFNFFLQAIKEILQDPSKFGVEL